MSLAVQSIHDDSGEPSLHRPVSSSLQAHHASMESVHMRDLFATDPARFERFSLHVGELLLDYSKNRVTDETMRLLVCLAEEAGVAGWRERMFAGEKINHTENRAVLHVALRNRGNHPMVVDGEDVMPKVNAVIESMGAFAEQVRSGQWRGYTGERITAVMRSPV